MINDLSNFTELDTVYELNIGKSFQQGSKTSYHQFKYDFTPASIDKNQEAKVNIGIRNDVSIQVPHVDGAAQKYTQFTGNKQPCSTKECVLIYNTKTNEFTLERLQSNFILKRSRLEGSSKAQMITPRSITPTNESSAKKKKQDNNQSMNMSNTSLNTSHNTSMSGPEAASAKMTKPNSSMNQRAKEPPLSNSASNNVKKSVNLKDTTPPKPVQPIQNDDIFGDDLNLSDGSDED